MIRHVAIALSALTLVAADAPPAVSVTTEARKWVGLYDGGQMELAAGLELRGDATFRYALSYGALDEAAEGQWQLEGKGVRLKPTRYVTNDPENRDQRFGDSLLTIAGNSLTLPRYGRLLKFSRD